jgi:hypothetical protein
VGIYWYLLWRAGDGEPDNANAGTAYAAK